MDADELALVVAVDNDIDKLVEVNTKDTRVDAVDVRVVAVDARVVSVAGGKDASAMCGK